MKRIIGQFDLLREVSQDFHEEVKTELIGEGVHDSRGQG